MTGIERYLALVERGYLAVTLVINKGLAEKVGLIRSFHSLTLRSACDRLSRGSAALESNPVATKSITPHQANIKGP